MLPIDYQAQCKGGKRNCSLVSLILRYSCGSLLYSSRLFFIKYTQNTNSYWHQHKKMSDNSFITGFIALKNSPQNIFHLCVPEVVYLNKELHDCRKYKLLTKSYQIIRYWSQWVMSTKTGIWRDMIFILWISWKERWEQRKKDGKMGIMNILFNGNKHSKVPISFQQ